MLHQNEMPKRNGTASSATQNPGSGNRESASAQQSSDFYNNWDGGGAGGAHTRDQPSRGTHSGRGPKNYRRSDERILDDAHRALTEDDMLDATEIEVMVEGGAVTLTGTVQSRKDRRRAEELLDHLHGVTDVHNQIRIG